MINRGRRGRSRRGGRVARLAIVILVAAAFFLFDAHDVQLGREKKKQEEEMVAAPSECGPNVWQEGCGHEAGFM